MLGVGLSSMGLGTDCQRITEVRAKKPAVLAHNVGFVRGKPRVYKS